jgi:hypothetical protein
MNIQNCFAFQFDCKPIKKRLRNSFFRICTFRKQSRKGIKFHRTFRIFLSKVLLWLFWKCQNGSAHHKQPKSAIMFCVERFKIWTTINEPFGFNNRFNSLIVQIRDMFQNVPHTNHVKRLVLIRLYLPQMRLLFLRYFCFILIPWFANRFVLQQIKSPVPAPISRILPFAGWSELISSVCFLALCF